MERMMAEEGAEVSKNEKRIRKSTRKGEEKCGEKKEKKEK